MVPTKGEHVTRLDLGNVHVSGLGFREQRVKVISSANKQGHKALFYPGSGSRRIIPYVLLVWIDFDGVVTMARSQSLWKQSQW